MNLFPIETIYTSGSTLYAVVRGLVAGVPKVWNPTLNTGLGAWDTYNASNWSQYAIAMVEDMGSGYYSGAYPTLISGVLTTDVVYLQGGGSPTLGDSPLISCHSQGPNVAAIAGSVTAALNLGASTGSQQLGALTGIPTAGILPTNLSSSTDDQYLGRILIMTSGAAVGQVQYITAYDGTTKTITLAALLVTTPAATDTFVIV